MENELISVIIPTHNSSQYIKKCLNSIVSQTYKNLEIIVINDGSTDSTKEILENLQKKDKRIIIINKSNSGVSDSRNKGIEVSNGKYITFVDDDDWLEIDAIEKLYNCIKINADYSIVRGRYIKEYSDGTNENAIERFIMSEEHKDNIEKLINEVLSGNLYCYMWLLLIRTDIVKNKVFFNTNLAMMEDTIFYLDLLLNGNDIYFLDDITYHYFFNKNSASRSVNNCIRNYNNALLVNKLFKEKLDKKNKNSIIRNKIYDTKTSKSIAEAIYLLFKKDRQKMKKLYKEVCSSDDVMRVLNNCELNKINKQNSIIVYLLCKKKYYFLKIFLSIREILSKVKNIITKRKNVV